MPNVRRTIALVSAVLAAITLTACSDAPTTQEPSTFRHRGVIEGFYGQPYDTATRARIIRFIGARGMNAYVYAPKNDPLHRDQWRTPYDEQQLADFAELARAGRESGVRFYFAIAPGITYDRDDPADFERLADKLRGVHERGVTGFALLFDDLLDPASTALDPELQASLTARVADLVASFGPDTDLWFIGHVYTGLADDLRANRGLFATLSPLPPQVYYDAYADLVPATLPLMWTGPGVFSARLTRADAQDFRDFASGRPLVIWDNFPVNDSLPRELFLGPYLGREADLAAAADGVVLNLMSQPIAGLIAVATAAEYFADPASYDPETAWHRAIGDVGGAGAEALELFAAQHRGHPVLAGADEATELGERIAAAFAGAGTDDDGIAKLRAYLERLAENRAALQATIDDPQLLAEIRPWSDKLTELAAAGLAGLDALAGRADAATFRSARVAATTPGPLVAATLSNSGLATLSGGVVNPPVDRFADLFAAIDARLGGS
ncbi:beta-N-acetylglucosaminidase domain-containing protein [Candidatus Binatia bacterium]|nr:beta-N-acetylglucosaminidase domain-containing protein [Candidatus Binatia bacterium]